jgi:murein DD-endopeptidase MepM/ murein hydrolase activator NlpD
MNKKLSFFVLSTSGSPIKQLTVSKRFLRFLLFLVFAGVLISGYAAYDYYALKKSLPNTRELESKITGQQDEISTQRRQIQNFAQEINTLKEKLIDLNRFEKKIRVIANIEKTSGQDGLFGVGGSMPEDLDTSLNLENKHNSLLREMHEHVDQLTVASIKQNEGFKSLLKYLEDQRNLLASTPAVTPVLGWITSRFGYRKSPFTGRREFHKGLDIATRKKSPIIATADGVVTYIGVKGLLGKIIIIDHGHGMSTRYGHINKALKKVGEPVTRGEKIALVGNSGRTTGSHVHYEVLLNGIPVNPEKYIID